MWLSSVGAEPQPHQKRPHHPIAPRLLPKPGSSLWQKMISPVLPVDCVCLEELLRDLTFGEKKGVQVDLCAQISCPQPSNPPDESWHRPTPTQSVPKCISLKSLNEVPKSPCSQQGIETFGFPAGETHSQAPHFDPSPTHTA